MGTGVQRLSGSGTSAKVLGFEGFDLEGFDVDGKYLRPRLDYITDFEGISGVDDSAQAALRVLAAWEAAADRPHFVNFTARALDE